jgi:hypothetical protein
MEHDDNAVARPGRQSETAGAAARELDDYLVVEHCMHRSEAVRRILSPDQVRRKGGLMIEIHQQIAPESCTGTGSAWRAVAMVEGRSYEATSRHGVPMALARVLVAAGVPDQPVVVTTDDLRGEVRYRSLHRMALRTMTETSGQSLRSIPWRAYTGPSLAGEADVLASGIAAEKQAPKTAIFRDVSHPAFSERNQRFPQKSRYKRRLQPRRAG